MNQTRLIFKNTVVFAAAQLLDIGTSTLLAFFVSRVFHASGLGIYATATTYYGVIALAAEMGSSNLLVREIAKDLAATNRYVVHLCVMASGLGALIMAAGFLIVPHLDYSPELTSCLHIIILAIIPGTLNTIQEAVLIAHQRAEFMAYASLVKSIVNISISLYLLYHGYGIISLLIAFVIIQYIVMFVYFIFINVYISHLHWIWDLKFAISLLRQQKTFAASSILAGLFARPEVILLSLSKSTAYVGYYSAAAKVVDLWQFVPQAFMVNVFPILSRSYQFNDRKWQRIQDKAIKLLLATSLPLAAGITVAAKPILRLLFGPGFGSAILTLQLLAWSIPLVAVNAVLWRMLSARGEQYMVLRIQGFTTVVRLGFGILAIAWLGAVGAALSTLVILLIHNQLLSHYIKRDGTNVQVPRLGWRLALAALGMAGVTAAVMQLWTDQLWALVPIAAVAYVALAALFTAFSHDDLALIRSIWQRDTAARAG